MRGFAESGALSVDMNNNSGGLVGEDVLKGGQKNQSFKAFLEVGGNEKKTLTLFMLL